MNTIAEKLASAEKQIQEILEQWRPLAEQLSQLEQDHQTARETLNRLEQQNKTLRDDLDSALPKLESVISILAESKTEGANLASKQEENEQLCSTLTGMFGEAFQVVSRFLDTAQKIGIIDKSKTQEILAAAEPATVGSAKSESAALPEIAEPAVDEPVEEVEEISEPVEEVMDESVAEPQVETPIVEPEPIVAEPVVTASVVEEPAVEEPVEDEPVEEAVEVDEEPVDEPPTEEATQIDEAATENAEVEPLSPAEMASEMNLPPLPLNLHPDPVEGEVLSAEEEQHLEDLLSNLSQPISTE